MGRAAKRKNNGVPNRPQKIRRIAGEEPEWTGFSQEKQEIAEVESSEEEGAEDGMDDDIVAMMDAATRKPSSQSAEQGSKEAAPLPVLSSMAQSDLAALQIDALLERVQPADESAGLDTLLDDLEASLKRLSPVAEAPIKEATSALRKKGVCVPFRSPAGNAGQYKLAFQPPTSIARIGSHALDSVCCWKGQDGWNIDLAVVMPTALLQANDHKEHRYFHKRAYFLACLASGLQHSKLADKLELTFAPLNGDTRRPVLELRPRKTNLAELRCVVRLLPVYELSNAPLKFGRLHPSKNNLRAGEEADEETGSSPSYNAGILADGLILEHHAFLEQTSQRAPNFATACQLLKVWAHQRGFGESSAHRSEAGLEGGRFLLTMLLAHLLTRNERQGVRLSPRADAWQMVRVLLDWLGQGEILRKPLAMQRRESLSTSFELKAFAQDSQPVLLDPCGLLNLLQDVPRASLELLSYHARITAQDLAATGLDGFEDAFTKPLHALHLQFDNSVTISLDGKALKEATKDAKSPISAMSSKLSSVVRRALDTRAVALSVSSTRAAHWAIGSQVAVNSATVSLGVILNAAEAGRLVDFGPPAEDRDAAESFREFWGDKSELRRFKDGNILESVVWPAETPLARGAIVGRILRYILCESTHFHLPSASVRIFAAAYDGLLSDGAHAADKGFAEVRSAYDALAKSIRAVEDLPLAISNVSPVSESLRYSSVFVPLAHPQPQRLPAVARYVPVMDVHVTFEGSSRWPTDLEAIQKIKAAILAKLAEGLRAGAERVLRAELAFDVNAPVVADNVVLEILTASGFGFRLRVHYEAEPDQIQEALLAAKGTPRAGGLAAIGHSHAKRFTARPRHSAAIAALQHRHAAFSSGIRVFKRWLSAHLLSPHVTAEAAELLIAHVMLCPGTQSVPASGATAFARTLSLLASHNWREHPLLTPLYTAVDQDADKFAIQGKIVFPADKVEEAKKLFANTRKADPLVRRGALLLATEQDLGGREWTWNAPSRIVLSRLVDLAKATLSALERGLEQGDLDIRTLFTTPLDAYDFVIHLDAAQLSRYSQNVHADVDILRASKASPSTPALLGYDPAAVLFDRLQSYLGDTAVLFHDINGGSVIAGVFDPALIKPRAWRVHLGFPCRPVKGDEAAEERQVSLDKEAVLAGVRRLGGTLVQRIDQRS